MSKELRRLERICLVQAELCSNKESRVALLGMALNYKQAAQLTPSFKHRLAGFSSAIFKMPSPSWLSRVKRNGPSAGAS
jgi:hypothetical protein